MLKKISVTALALALSVTPAVAKVRLPLTGNLQKDLGNLPIPLAPLTGNPIADVKTAIDTVATALLTKIYDKLKTDGSTAILDANVALQVAGQKLADGSVADQPSVDCLTAVIPVMQVITNNASMGAPTPAASGASVPTAATPEAAITSGAIDGPITVFVKLRVVINAISSPGVQKACSVLQVQTGNTGLTGTANVLAGFIGITKLTPLAPAALGALGL